MVNAEFLNDIDNSITDFDDVKNQISIGSPLICTLIKILKFNDTEKFLTVIVQDEKNHEILAFIYGDLAKILNSTRVFSRLPFNLAVIKGQLKELSKKKKYLEIHQAIIEKDTNINSNWIGSYNFCEMQTFLNIYINAYSDINENLLWGNLFHDYLSILFSSSSLKLVVKKKHSIEQIILSSFIKACYINWAYLTVLRKKIDIIVKDFENNFLLNEIDFINNEFKHYSGDYGKFDIICEKMIFSRHLGLQGRIDRLVHNIPFSKFSIIETKTGTSQSSSQMTAFYQCMAYATILQEYFPLKVDKLIIEYPRFPVNERLIEFQYDKNELIKVLKIRNEIWSILIGNQPHQSILHSCSRCSSLNACEFYQYRHFINDPNYKLAENNQFKGFFEQNAQNQALFKRINAYFSWFFYHLDNEFKENLTIINEVHLPAEIRERKGNCIANLQIKLKQDGIQGNSIIFCKKNDELIQNSRFRKGEHILVSPQNFIPLQSESKRGIVQKISSKEVTIKFFKHIDSRDQFILATSFRIDLTTSNYMINLQKQAVDMLIRYSLFPNYPHIKKLRDLLLFQEYPKLESANKEQQLFEDSFQFDPSQERAIITAMRSKDITLIHGPPGTGKTTIITEIVNRLVMRYHQKKKKNLKNSKKSKIGLDHYFGGGKKRISTIHPVLISAYTNKAVDNLVLKLILKYPELKIVRLGNISSIDDPRILKHNVEYICRNTATYPSGETQSIIDPLKARLILDHVDVIATTTTFAGNILLANKHFETVILDEAAQIVESSALIPLLKGNHFILVGDHQQLPPIVKEKDKMIPKESKDFLQILHFSPERGLGISIFERLIFEFAKSPCYTMLSFQYRMNKIISNFISEKFYDGKLLPGVINKRNIGDQSFNDFIQENGLEGFDCSESNLWSQFFQPELPMVFIDTINIEAPDSAEFSKTKELTSKFNKKEVEIVVRIIGHFIKEIINLKGDLEKIIEILNQIGIISGYRSQNQKIKEDLRNYLDKYIFSNSNLDIKDFNVSEKEDILKAIIIDTVDRFQGQEREIIIYSFVDSNPQCKIDELNQELRRLNVAISRAKKKIIFVGNSPTLCQLEPKLTEKTKNVKIILNDLIEYIKSHNGYFII